MADATPAGKGSPGVHAIRSMFAALGLPVCDDQQAIEAARDSQRDTRNRQLNSTKGSVAVAAQAWFESVDALLTRRQALIEALYAEFSALADAVLVVAGAAGRRRLRGKARGELQGLATRWLGARPDLATLWVQRWMEERGAARWAGGVPNPSSWAPTESADTAGEAPSGRRRLLLAVGSAMALVVALAGLYHSVGLGPGEDLLGVVKAATHEPRTSPGAIAASTARRQTAEASDNATEALPTPDSVDPTHTLPAWPGREAMPGSAPRHGPLPSAVAATVQSPDICFGGHRLQLLVRSDSPLSETLVREQWNGLSLSSVRRTGQGLELELTATRLAPDRREGVAHWSFRVSDEQGRLSQPFSGSLHVLPGGW